MQQFRIKRQSCFHDIILQQMTIFRTKSAVHAKHYLLQMIEKIFHAKSVNYSLCAYTISVGSAKNLCTIYKHE